MTRPARLRVMYLAALLVGPHVLTAQPSSAPSDTAALALLYRARAARRLHAESLNSYSATATQRLSLSIGLSAVGLQRLAYRHENAARVRWTRGEPIHVALLGSRSYIGAWKGNFGGATDRDLANAVPLPYFPGREQLWSGDGMVTDFVGQARAIQDSISSRELIHPLATGAESFYRYELGDSMAINLPSGRRIQLRELRIAARTPRWNLIVGAFWFDVETANLTRAAYRLSVPTDIGAVTRERNDRQQMPRWLSAFISPMSYEITAITIEFGLVGERFWLPRAQSLEGTARAGRARATMRIDQRFAYDEASGTIAALPAEPALPADSSERLVRSTRFGGAARVVTRVPRDRDALARSTLLPPSIFDDSESLFDDRARRELLSGLGLGLQAEWSPQAPTLQFGLPLTRFNRIEGISTGLGATSELGRGYALHALARVSAADKQLNGELGITRSTGDRVVSMIAYRRLVAMNDWGEPLSASASVPAFLFGRDDGAYFRASGAELVSHNARRQLMWRLFFEHEQSANVETRWSLFGSKSRALPNPRADHGAFAGASARLIAGSTEAPAGLQLRTDSRVELAVGESAYSRVLTEAVLSHTSRGLLRLALSAAAGSSVGTVPAQRLFTVGGTHSVRGTRALSAFGNSMWLARADVGANLRVVRPSIFGDIGWAGDRRRWTSPGRPHSGAGIGFAAMHGLIRLDVARGIYPARTARADFYLDARF